jgi:alcohol dehydrogenase (cytochrome c)
MFTLMKASNRWTIAGVLAVAALAAGFAQQPLPPVQAPMPDILKAYSPVTEERLRKPSDADWLMIRRTYDGWGYSPLNEITPANINRLQPAWVFATGVSSGHEAAPVVNNGVMFISTPSHRVVAIDARTGTILWRYIKEVAENVVAPHPTSRGVALYGDKVFFAANDAVLVALNARTGEQAWTAKVAENKNG